MSMFDILFAKSLSGGSGGGGSGLPAVTSDDNGDLLGVVEGAWGKVDPPAGVETFTVTLTESSDTWTADKTIAEIIEAYEAGKNCVATGINWSGTTVEFALTAVATAVPAVSFNGMLAGSDFRAFAVVGFVDDNTDIWTVTQQSLDGELPAVTGADDGKLLGVSNGEWAKVASNAPLMITGTVAGTSVTITTPLADIKAAFDAGRMVYLDVLTVRVPLVHCEEAEGSITVAFTMLNYDTDDNDFMSVAVIFDGSLTGIIDLK